MLELKVSNAKRYDAENVGEKGWDFHLEAAAALQDFRL
ncbi:hypothetical protein ACVWZ8_003711 [Arthrobacter sp. UYCu723]